MAISKDTTTGKWIVPFSTTDTELNSANKYIDANIVVKAPTVLSPSTTYYQTTDSGYGALGTGYLGNTYYIKAAQLAAAASEFYVTDGEVTCNATASGFTKSSSATSYYVNLAFSKTDGSAGATYSRSIGTAGWISTVEVANYSSLNHPVGVTKPADTKIYIPAATVTANASVTSTPSVDVSGAATGFTASSSATSYYVTVTGTPTNGSASGGYTVGNAAGMVAANATNSTSATITPTVNGSGTKIYIPAGSMSCGTVPSGDDSDSISSLTFTNATNNYTITSANSSFEYHGEATVVTAGYIASGTINSETRTHTTSVSATVAKAGITTSVTGTLKVTPVISKQSTPSGVTNAASGNATTTAPSSGVYVAVQSAAASNTATATISSVTAGYTDGTHHSATQGTASVGANASAMTYIPITTGSAAVTSGQTISLTATGPTIDSTNHTATWSLSKTQSISGTASTPGWITSVSSANVTASGSVVVTLYNGETV